MTLRASGTTSGVTQSRVDNSNLLATTAFVNQQLSGNTASIPITTAGGLYNQASLGTGLTIVIFVSGGVVQSILSVIAGGTGYANGDLLVLPAGNADAAVIITNAVGGVVQSGGVSVVYGGSGYTTGATVTAAEVPPGQRAVEMSGTLTSNVTFIVTSGTRLTASRKPWFANNTTGPFTVTVFLSNGAGGTIGNGVVIPQGTNNSTGSLLYTDGINDIWTATTLPTLQPIRTVTTTGNVLFNDYTVLGNATGGAIVMTLPAAASCPNRVLAFKKIDASANMFTVNGNGSEHIDAANTNVLSAQYAAVLIQSDGTQWWII